MQRLRKGRELEDKRDIREVQRDLSLIRSPAAGTSVIYLAKLTINFRLLLRDQVVRITKIFYKRKNITFLGTKYWEMEESGPKIKDNSTHSEFRKSGYTENWIYKRIAVATCRNIKWVIQTNPQKKKTTINELINFMWVQFECLYSYSRASFFSLSVNYN